MTEMSTLVTIMPTFTIEPRKNGGNTMTSESLKLLKKKYLKIRMEARDGHQHTGLCILTIKLLKKYLKQI